MENQRTNFCEAIHNLKVAIMQPLAENKNAVIELKVERIERIVCAFYAVTVEQMKQKTRLREYLTPRQVCQYFIREFTSLSLNSIGHRYGLDYSTVINSIKKVNDYIDTDKQFSKDMKCLQVLIEGKK